ncbi:hypothetical protein VTL71DRAFT_3032 [Oculimacula yallundae]|uniref:RING-type domain-containing protein n=1 Tax=Oculimacula yallundae TaxID=86028 RepID=A0ABR4C5Z3_9HELO
MAAYISQTASILQEMVSNSRGSIPWFYLRLGQLQQEIGDRHPTESSNFRQYRVEFRIWTELFPTRRFPFRGPSTLQFVPGYLHSLANDNQHIPPHRQPPASRSDRDGNAEGESTRGAHHRRDMAAHSRDATRATAQELDLTPQSPPPTDLVTTGLVIDEDDIPYSESPGTPNIGDPPSLEPEICHICWEYIYYDESQVAAISCPQRHIYHRECIESWMSHSNRCARCGMRDVVIVAPTPMQRAMIAHQPLPSPSPLSESSIPRWEGIWADEVNEEANGEVDRDHLPPFTMSPSLMSNWADEINDGAND